MIKTQQHIDEQWMQMALAQAKEAESHGEVPIGAVLVKDNQLIAAGHNRSIRDKDPSGHAEIVVLREAGKMLSNHRLNDTSLYVTLEPCVMCMGAILQARIARLIFAAYDKRAGACGSVFDLAREPALNHHIAESKGGVFEASSREMLQTFFQQRRKRN